MKVNTVCVHSGNNNDDFYGALHTPIYLTSNYRLPTDGTPVDWSGINSNIYARNRNVNQTARTASCDQALPEYLSGLVRLGGWRDFSGFCCINAGEAHHYQQRTSIVLLIREYQVCIRCWNRLRFGIRCNQSGHIIS